MATDDRYNEGFKSGVRSVRSWARTGPEGRPFWQDEPCPTWCVEDHHDGEMYDDRSHFSDEHSVKLSLEKSEEGGPKQFNLSLTSHYREREPRIAANVDGHIGVHFTLAEAAQVAAALHRLVEEGHGRRDGGDVGLRPVA
jgi:hypothetical protein